MALSLSLLKPSRLHSNCNTADYLIRHFGGAFPAQAKRWRHAGQHLVHISVINTATRSGQSVTRDNVMKRRRRRRIGHSQGTREERKIGIEGKGNDRKDRGRKKRQEREGHFDVFHT